MMTAGSGEPGCQTGRWALRAVWRAMTFATLYIDEGNLLDFHDDAELWGSALAGEEIAGPAAGRQERAGR